MNPLITETSYIMAIEEGGSEIVEHFDSRDEVFIKCVNIPDDDYYIKVEETGGTLLSTLEDANGSIEHSVSVICVPVGEDQTYHTNFKIESSIPTGQVVVEVYEIIEGEKVPVTRDSDIFGAEVILGRELGLEPIATQFKHYLNPFKGMEERLNQYMYHPYDGSSSGERLELEDIGLVDDDPFVIKFLNSRYSDEAKLVGWIGTDSEGDPVVGYESNVCWEIRDEPLKIGGYFFLIDTTNESLHFTTNLDLPNPSSEDGELVKEVHITREGIINVELIIQYE
jgi:hypothetical protein